MGTCIYCGKSAGIFHHLHATCQAKHGTALTDIVSAVSDAASGQCTVELARAKIVIDEKEGFIDPEQASQAAKAGWCQAADLATALGAVTKEQEQQLTAAIQSFGLNWSNLRHEPAGIRFLQGQILRRIADNEPELPGTLQIQTSILAPASEKRFWSENSVRYYEDRTHHHTVGGSHGVSLRVMRGVYYHAGAHKGTSVTTHGYEFVDTGDLLVTGKKLYFAGASKAFSIPLPKIVSIEPFEDGVKLHRDAITAKPQAFESADGVFLANLVQALCLKRP